jgi:phytoene dehydrogenase-like protein
MANQKSIIIIGAGMSGLSAGCYAQMNGFDSMIFEMGDHAGGVCTSWKRGDYNINGSMHWLVGSAPNVKMHQMWLELGAIQDKMLVNHDIFLTLKNVAGQEFKFYTNLFQLEKYIHEIAPEDKEEIDDFIKAIKVFIEYDLPTEKAQELFGLFDGLKLIFTEFPMLMEAMKWSKITIAEFAAKLKSPLLQKAFLSFWHPEMSMTTIIVTLAWMHKRTAGYPMGGSGAFIESVEERYKHLGGNIAYHSKVEKIITYDDTAVGVQLTNGRQYFADYIISAADGYNTIFKMLGGKYIDENITKIYQTFKPFPSIFFIALGIDESFEELESTVVGYNLPMKQPLKIGNTVHERATVQIYNFDPTLAPEGKTLMTCFLSTDYQFWHSLYQNKALYEAEKDRIINDFIHNLLAHFPHISDKIEMQDCATPMTYNNYTGNYQGSYEGWLPTPEASKIHIKKTLPNLHHFFMIGHWVETGGGLPPAAMSGRNVVQLMCHQEGRKFKSYISSVEAVMI